MTQELNDIFKDLEIGDRFVTKSGVEWVKRSFYLADRVKGTNNKRLSNMGRFNKNTKCKKLGA